MPMERLRKDAFGCKSRHGHLKEGDWQTGPLLPSTSAPSGALPQILPHDICTFSPYSPLGSPIPIPMFLKIWQIFLPDEEFRASSSSKHPQPVSILNLWPYYLQLPPGALCFTYFLLLPRDLFPKFLGWANCVPPVSLWTSFLQIRLVSTNDPTGRRSSIFLWGQGPMMTCPLIWGIQTVLPPPVCKWKREGGKTKSEHLEGRNSKRRN